MDTERSPAARLRAERALCLLIAESGGSVDGLIVIGGLVPQTLVEDSEPPPPAHLGTTDVDVAIDFSVVDDALLPTLEDALLRLGFQPTQGQDGWRWRGVIDGAPVIVEFLCDMDNRQSGHIERGSGCRYLSACNLRGTGYVRSDATVISLGDRLVDGRTVPVRVSYAGVCGYLLAKSVAARERGKEKDYYDLVYVLLYNRLGGPAAAGAALLEGPLSEAIAGLQTVWGELRARFATPGSFGPGSYAAQSQLVDPGADRAILRQDAVAAVSEFLRTLGY